MIWLSENDKNKCFLFFFKVKNVLWKSEMDEGNEYGHLPKVSANRLLAFTQKPEKSDGIFLTSDYYFP